jgi:hypothetical protein
MTWFSSLVRRRNCAASGSRRSRSVAKDYHAQRRGGGKGAAKFSAAERTLAAEHRCAIQDSRWWVPERTPRGCAHDGSARTKFGKSSNTHLVFRVRLDDTQELASQLDDRLPGSAPRLHLFIKPLQVSPQQASLARDTETAASTPKMQVEGAAMYFLNRRFRSNGDSGGGVVGGPI